MNSACCATSMRSPSSTAADRLEAQKSDRTGPGRPGSLPRPARLPPRQGWRRPCAPAPRPPHVHTPAPLPRGLRRAAARRAPHSCWPPAWRRMTRRLSHALVKKETDWTCDVIVVTAAVQETASQVSILHMPCRWMGPHRPMPKAERVLPHIFIQPSHPNIMASGCSMLQQVYLRPHMRVVRANPIPSPLFTQRVAMQHYGALWKSSCGLKGPRTSG